MASRGVPSVSVNNRLSSGTENDALSNAFVDGFRARPDLGFLEQFVVFEGGAATVSAAVTGRHRRGLEVKHVGQGFDRQNVLKESKEINHHIPSYIIYSET